MHTEIEKQGVLFIDLDTVVHRQGYAAGKTVEQLRMDYEKQVQGYQRNKLDLLYDSDILEMDAWDASMLENLRPYRKLAKECVYCSKKAMDPGHFKIMMQFLEEYGVQLLAYGKTLEEAIREYMKEKEEPNRFFVISRKDLRNVFPRKCYQMKEKGANNKLEIQSYVNMACHGNPNEFFAWDSEASNETLHDIFYKVIFLDIDGVLNDEGKHYTEGVVIDRNMVKCLRQIVDATDARIILSSSWKKAYFKHVKHGICPKDSFVPVLLKALEEYGLVIDGMTPFVNVYGTKARAWEIRSWLMRFWGTHSYVILDDGTFWKWGWLQMNVVTTITETEDGYVKGLTPELAQQAIAILEDKGAYVECF